MSSTLLPSCPVAGTVPEKRQQRSLFGLRSTFFESCRLLPSARAALVASLSHHLDSEQLAYNIENQAVDGDGEVGFTSKSDAVLSRWTCNTCKAEFESLQDQRSHFKSDLHLINVRRSLILIFSLNYFLLEHLQTSDHRFPAEKLQFSTKSTEN